MTTPSNHIQPFLNTQDFLVSGERFELHWNEHKDMLVTHPVPEPESLGAYYKSDAYISHTDASKKLSDKLYQFVKAYALLKKVALVKSWSPNGTTLLDVGAGTGDFLKAARQAGWNVSGVETNKEAVARAAQKLITLQSSTVAFKKQKFDVITLWHVLEHLPNPEERIAEYAQLLNPGGVLLVAVPNFKSWDASHYKDYWAAYDVPRHLYHFSKESIQRISQPYFDLKKVKPMIFDAFYVSLLSEKYKRSWSPLILGFFSGLLSNINSWFTKEASSHIYVLKKR